MNTSPIPKSSITFITPPHCSEYPRSSKLKLILRLIFVQHQNINSGAVNGIDFSEEFIGDEDIETRNKMFEEVSEYLRVEC